MKRTLLMAFVAFAFGLTVTGTAPAQDVMSIAGDKVGIGTDIPGTLLHIVENLPDWPMVFTVENIGSGFAGFRFTTTSGSIDFNKAGGEVFRINIVDGDAWEMELQPDGDLEIKGSIYTAGSCSGGCDRVFSAGYDLPTIEEHAASMWNDSYLPVIGPTPEGQSFNLTDKTERMLNELEVAHIFIDQLNTQLKDKDARISDLEERLARLEAIVRTLGARL